MSGGLDTQPTATTLDVERLARRAWEGRIRIPHFQRPLISALFAGKESAKGDTPTLDRIAQNINDDLAFGLIDNDTVLQAVLARRAPDVHRQIRNEFGEEARAFIEFPDEDRDTAYRQGEEAIRAAVRFLQSTVDVPHFTLLPYKYPSLCSRGFSGTTRTSTSAVFS